MTEIKSYKEISEYFLADSRDFLARFNILLEKSLNGHIGMRSKLLIDLLFSAECCIKALILFYLDCDKLPNKFFCHNINKLLSLLPSEEIESCKKFLNETFIDFSIENRYMIETYKTFRSDRILDNNYYNTIANPKWLTDISKELKELIRYVAKKVEQPIKVIKFSEIDINSIQKSHIEKMNFRKK